jgi:hypothetical protein
MSMSTNMSKLFSFAVVLCMVFSGLVILAPAINDIAPIAPDTANIARAGDPLPPGELPAHQDGRAGDGGDVLIIYEYMSTSARHQHPSYGGGWDYYYVGLGTMVDDLHYFGYTVDTWYNYYYLGGYNPGRRMMGSYDGEYRHNYYPVDSNGYPDTIESYDDYKMVIIMGYSSMWTFGSYNYNGAYETARPVTAERTLTGLEDYAANGGSIYLAGYYTPYYLFYTPYYVGNSAVQSSFRTRMSAMFDVTTGYNYAGYGYSSRGVEGTTPNTGANSIGYSSRDYEDLWGSNRVGSSGTGGYVSVSEGDRIEAVYHSVRNPFPDAYSGYSTYRNYQYLYYTQNAINDGIKVREHSSAYGWYDYQWPGSTNAVQSDHGGEFNTVVCFSHHTTGTAYYRHSSGSYRYGPGMMQQSRIPWLGSIIDFMIDEGEPAQVIEIAAVHPVEVQSSGSDDEWVELANTIADPVNLKNYSIGIGGGSRAPSSTFGDYDDLGEFGVAADLMDHTYYLNAEDLYIDTYWADGTGTYNNFYLYKVSNGNDYGKYYSIGSSYTNWWDSNDQTFLTEDEKDGKSLGYLEDYVYQVRMPADSWARHVYIRLNTGDAHKYENNQIISTTNPGGSYLDIDLEAMVDGNVTTPNTKTQALMDYWMNEYTKTLKSATLEDYYVYDTLTFGYRLYLYDDIDGTMIGNIYMPSSSYFWKITSLPYGGTIFVNDNHPNTMFYYSHYNGAQVGGPGMNIQEIDITDDTYFEHYTNELYFEDDSRTYGSTTIDFTSANIRNQISAVTVTAPILTDTIFVNKNTRAFTSGPAGGDIVEIMVELMEDDFSYLFPRGATYRDYTTAGAPSRGLNHVIVVDDSKSDVDGNKNELVANGQIRMWNHGLNDYEGAAVGWGTSGPAPEPAGGMSAQAYFDGSKYKFGNFWTLGAESKGVDNSVAAPAYGSVDVVINEVNPTFVEMYNRGGSSVNLNGWKLTGEGNTFTMSGSIGPGGFHVVSESDFYIPFTPVTGGRISLFDDLGVLVSSIGYQTEVPGSGYSYTQRHIDGVGNDYGYNDSQLTPYAMGDMSAQKNEDWVMGEARSTGAENYDGLSILQIGTIKDSPWSLIENLSMYNPDWADGSLGAKKIDQYYLNNFDVIFCVGGMNAASSPLLNDYLLDGGRLYVEFGDWSTLAATDLYRTMGIEASNAANSPASLMGVEPVTGGIEVAYSGSTTSKFTPNAETFRVLEEGGTTYAVLNVDIDTSNPANSHRAVASALKYEKMSPVTRSELYDYTGMIMDYFLMSDDAVNHAPVLELKDPIPNPEIPLYKARPTLLWQNKDVDVWDQVPGTMEYTLYIDTNQGRVINMNPDVRSSVFVQETSTATMVDALDAPVAGIYYWAIFAEDKYGKTTYETGGAFKYDSETPNVDTMTAMSGDTMDDPLPIGITRVFGPGYMNSQGDTIGRPGGFAVDLSDNFGLKFSNNNRVAEQLFIDEYLPPTTAFSVKVMYFYGGQYEDDLPNFNMYVDMMGTNNDLESLTGMDSVTFYIIPDGPIPDGQYHFYIQAADEVRWGSYMDWSFEVDLSAPETPVDIMIDPETYVDQFDELYLKAGETYTLSAWAPSSSEDGSMNRVEFQQAVANYPGATWETIGTDYDVTDNVYSVVWTPDTAHFYLRAIAYDYVENFAISEVSSAFHVDGAGPEAPLTLQATLDLTHTPIAKINGYVYDRIIEGQTSGVDYVVIWHYDEASGMMELVTDDQDQVLMVPVIDFQFDVDVSLDAITGATGDLSYAYYAQAYDHVGNAGDMSDIATWTNTGMEEALRVISPSSIKDIPMGMDVEDTDDSLDEVRSITVTFLNTEQDFMNYQFTIRGEQLRTASQAADLGLPDGTKFLYNYFNVEVPPEFTNFEAQVTIVFHISQRSQLGTRTSEILENIRLVTKHSGENSFEVLDLIGGQAQPVDEAKGLYRVQARVNRFSDFAVIVAQTDLTVKDIILGANPAISGQEMSITVTVHNGGDFPKDADSVRVKVFTIDEDGNQEYIGELDYGTIDAEKDYYLSDAYLRKGDKQATLYWTTSELLSDGEIQKFTIRTQVDPDGYVREISETNNEKTTMVEVVGSAQSSPSFELTFMLMALGVMLVSGMSVYIRKKD